MTDLNDEETAVVDLVRTWVDREVRPMVRELEHANTYLSVLPTRTFLYGIDPGDEVEVHLNSTHLVLLGIEAISEADERGQRNVLGTINGQLRPTQIRDRSVASTVTLTEKADPTNPRHVAVPFAGAVHALVSEGDTVEAGQTVATVEAMKMEASITTPSTGTIARLVMSDTRQAEGGDLLLELG